MPFSPVGAIFQINKNDQLLLELIPTIKPTKPEVLTMSFNSGDINRYMVKNSSPFTFEMLNDFDKNFFQPDWQEANFAQFQSDFKNIKSLIQNNKIKKAVPITYQKTAKKYDFWPALFTSLRAIHTHKSNDSFYAFWNANESYFIVGKTPEKLFEIKDNDLFTEAIAGTNYKNQKGDILNNKKELEEHLLVGEDLKEKLKDFGEVQISKPYTISSSHLDHIKSDIQCRLNQKIKITAALKKLHPSPALGTYPSSELNILKKLYPDSLRKLFGSPITYCQDKYAKAIVAIRNVQLINGYLWVFSGCGIVAESKLNEEWQELQEKRNVILKAYEKL